MKLKKKRPFAFSLWALFYVFSLFAVCFFLSPKFNRGSDGDNAYTFYSAGMTSWGELLRNLFVPKSPRVFLLDQWRPFAMIRIKLLWELGLSSHSYELLNIFMNWFAVGTISLGFCRLLSMGFVLLPNAPWMVASAVWWSAPLMIFGESAFYGMAVPFMTGVVFCILPTLSETKFRVLKWTVIGVLCFLICQTHESGWVFLFWLAGWLGLLQYFGRLKKGLPVFYVPLAFVAAHILIYRSFSMAQDGYIRPQQVSLSPGILGSNIAYYLLATLNGLASQIVDFFRGVVGSVDVTLYPSVFPFFLTLACLGTLVFARRDMGEFASRKKKDRKGFFFFAGAWFLLGMIGQTVPYWVLREHRFIYYVNFSVMYLASWFVLEASQRKNKLWSRGPVIAYIGANALVGIHTVQHWNWMNVNIDYVHPYIQAVLSRPEASGCSSESPCCVDFPGRDWARHEWSVNWEIGAPKHPAFFPKDWPGANCSRTFKVQF